jgi:hypothetical protein
MVRTLRFLLKLVLFGVCIGRAYAEIEQQMLRPRKTVRTTQNRPRA